MKLGSRRDGTRDGRLTVVARDLSRFLDAPGPYFTLQSALDDWPNATKVLSPLYDSLNRERASGSLFVAENMLSPLPRAYEWIDGSAFLNHVMLVRKSRGAEMPPSFFSDPLVYQGGSGIFLAPTDNIPSIGDAWGTDFESEVAVILGDVPMGTTSQQAKDYVRLVMIVNDVSLRNLIPDELAKGFGFFCSKPASAFAPVAVTTDELGESWRDGRVHLPLVTHLNSKQFGNPDAGKEMHFSFFDLIAHIAKTRGFTAGTILGSGTISNEDTGRGSSCLLEKRMLEKLGTGAIATSFLKPGDQVRIEMFDKSQKSIFGAIEQKVVQWGP